VHEVISLGSPVAQDCRLTARSADGMRRLGRSLAAHIHPGDMVCLYGELGAGKTTFVQGLAEALGTSEPATSPSFTIVHEYLGRLPLHHLDLYRLGPADLADIGVEEILEAEAVVVVEWAERLPSRLRCDALDIEIEFDPDQPDVRHLRLRAGGPRGQRLLRALAKHCGARDDREPTEPC